MPGLISSMFPEFDKTVKTYAPAARQLGRGLQQAGTGMLDLASLPFTATGVVEPQNVPGSTAWMDSKGLMIPEEKGENATDEFVLRSLQNIGSLAAPSAMGGAVGPVNNALKPPIKAGAGMFPQGIGVPDEIPLARGQMGNDRVMLGQAQQLGNEEKFAQRVHDFRRTQHEAAKKQIDNFANAIHQASNKGDTGETIHNAFDAWMGQIRQSYGAKNRANYQAFEAHPGSKMPMPVSQDSLDMIDDFIKKEVKPNSPDNWKRLMADLGQRSTVLMEPSLTPGEFKQHLTEANRAFRKDKMKPGVYDEYENADLDRVNGVFKAALKQRLDDSIKNGPPEVQEAGRLLERANHVFSTSINAVGDINNEAIMRFIGAKEGEELNPEAIVDKFKKLSETERGFFTQVANKVAPEMIPTMRRHLFDDMYNAGKVVGKTEGEASFSMSSFLRKADLVKRDNPALYDWVIGSDPAAKEAFEGTVEQMRAATNVSTNSIETTSNNNLANLAAGAIGATTGKVGAAQTSRGVMNMMGDMFKDKEAMYEHIFNQGPKPPGPGRAFVGNVAGKLPGGGPAVANPAQTGLHVGAAQAVASEAQDQIQQQTPVDPADLNWDAPAAPGGSMAPVDPEDLKW